VKGLLGRLKLQLRASQFHKRRRLNGNRFAVASAFEGLEVRSLLSGTALGGNVFTPVDYAELPSFEVSGTTIIGNQVLVHGTNADGHGQVESLKVTDALFSDPHTMVMLSEWNKLHPNDPSYMDVKGAYMGPNGIVFVSQNATTSNERDFMVVLDDGQATTVVDPSPLSPNARVFGVSISGDLALEDGGGYTYSNNQAIRLEGRENIRGITPSGGIIVGSKSDIDFNLSPQLYRASDGKMIDTSVDDSSIGYEGLRGFTQSKTGFVGTSTIPDSEGNYHEAVVSLSPTKKGYQINSLSAPYEPGIFRGVQEIGSAIYYLTDGPEKMDATIRVIGSNDTISVTALLGDLTGVTDVIVNSLELDTHG